MSKLEITGIKIDSEKDIESVTININYKAKDSSTPDSNPDSPQESHPSNSGNVPFKTVY